MIPFGDYFLVQRLTVGGMAEVFLATRRDDPEGPLLVVKRILPHLQDRSDFVQMFLDEARLTSSLFHDNLVQVSDFGKAEGVHYIAMEYVDGLSLSLVLRRQPHRKLPLIISCWMVAEACAGLAYAHARTGEDGRPLGIVHRDVSPDNILISQQGEVKLVDFGIAKAKIQLTRTRPGQIKGKFSYMSPEQGMRLRIDHRSDIFSAGLVLYEVTTGSRVFPAGNEVETLRALYERRYTPPEKLVDDYPPQLAAIVNRALAWDPGQRFQLAADMREALLELIPASATPQSDLGLLVQCLREQMQLRLPGVVADQSTKQQSAPKPIVLVPRPSDRETLLGIGAARTPRKPLSDVDTDPGPVKASGPDSRVETNPGPIKKRARGSEVETDPGPGKARGPHSQMETDPGPIKARRKALDAADTDPSTSLPPGIEEHGAPDEDDAPATVLQERPPFMDADVVEAVLFPYGDGPAPDAQEEVVTGRFRSGASPVGDDTIPMAALDQEPDEEPEPAVVDIDDRDTIKVPTLPDEIADDFGDDSVDDDEEQES